MTKLCGVMVYIAIYDQAVWCDILLFMTKLCGVMVYILLFMTKLCGVTGVYCYL